MSALRIAARNLIDRAYELESDAEIENLADQFKALEVALERAEDASPTVAPADERETFWQVACRQNIERWHAALDRAEAAEFALRAIAELPLPEQDNMLAANMRLIAKAVLDQPHSGETPT